MTYRLLHTADVHLDTAFAAHGCHGELARRRRTGLREALRTVGELAQAQRCEAVTIAGDLYEHERSGVDTARFLARLFASWHPLRVLIAPGNHDALLPGSLYRLVDWPANVHVFQSGELSAVELADGLFLWGLAHRDPAWTGDPLAGEARARGGGVHLALFHGAELGSRPEGKSIHGPFRAERIREAGFRLALSGHYHGRRIDMDRGLVYPGTPEPLAFDETGRRGPVLVEVGGDGGITCAAADTNRWTVLMPRADMSDCASTSEALDAVVATCQAGAAREPERTLARVDLTGDAACTLSLDVAALELEARERTGFAAVVVRDLTRAALDLEEAAGERSVRGAFVRAALAARATTGAEPGLLDDALRYGLEALAGAEVGLR